MLNHVVVHADMPEQIEAMEEWRDVYKPVGWKVYTPGRFSPEGWTHPWMLDDEEHGVPFLERARDLGVKLICSHKGISKQVDNGSPATSVPWARRPGLAVRRLPLRGTSTTPTVHLPKVPISRWRRTRGSTGS